MEEYDKPPITIIVKVFETQEMAGWKHNDDWLHKSKCYSYGSIWRPKVGNLHCLFGLVVRCPS